MLPGGHMFTLCSKLAPIPEEGESIRAPVAEVAQIACFDPKSADFRPKPLRIFAKR
jgi:hypothetical protein